MLPLIKPGAALIISPSPVSLLLPLCCFPLNGFYLATSGLVLYLPRRAYQEDFMSPMTFALSSLPVAYLLSLMIYLRTVS